MRERENKGKRERESKGKRERDRDRQTDILEQKRERGKYVRDNV